jgi:hypothetical protein
VDDAKHNDVVRLDAVEDPVRKMANDRPTCAAMKYLGLEGVLGDTAERRIKLGDELSSQPCPLQFIPTGCDANVYFRLPVEEQPVFHSLRRMSSRTFSHGSTSSGFASW